LVDNCNNGTDVFLYADHAKLFRHNTYNNDGRFITKGFTRFTSVDGKVVIQVEYKNVRLSHVVIQLTLKIIITCHLMNHILF